MTNAKQNFVDLLRYQQKIERFARHCENNLEIAIAILASATVVIIDRQLIQFIRNFFPHDRSNWLWIYSFVNVEYKSVWFGHEATTNVNLIFSVEDKISKCKVNWLFHPLTSVISKKKIQSISESSHGLQILLIKPPLILSN